MQLIFESYHLTDTLCTFIYFKKSRYIELVSIPIKLDFNSNFVLVVCYKEVCYATLLNFFFQALTKTIQRQTNKYIMIITTKLQGQLANKTHIFSKQ